MPYLSYLSVFCPAAPTENASIYEPTLLESRARAWVPSCSRPTWLCCSDARDRSSLFFMLRLSHGSPRLSPSFRSRVSLSFAHFSLCFFLSFPRLFGLFRRGYATSCKKSRKSAKKIAGRRARLAWGRSRGISPAKWIRHLTSTSSRARWSGARERSFETTTSVRRVFRYAARICQVNRWTRKRRACCKNSEPALEKLPTSTAFA